MFVFQFEQSEIISYYNYTAEVHTVITQQGYILTLVRCNSKKSFLSNKKVAILQHGVLGSSDDYVMYSPEQGLGKNKSSPFTEINRFFLLICCFQWNMFSIFHG